MENPVVPPPAQPTTSAPVPVKPSVTAPAPAKSPVVLHIKPKLGANFFSCAALALVFAFIILFGLAYLVSETGVVAVPFFSNLYEGPQPAHMVAVEALSGEQLQARIVQSLQSQVAENQTGPYVVRVSEGELSGVLVSGLVEPLGGRLGGTQDMQLAVRPDGLELSGEVHGGPFHVHFMAVFVPVLEGGVLSFTVQSVQIGDYNVPPSLAVKVISYVLSRDLSAWNLSFGKDVLKEIHLYDGYLEIVTGLPS